MRIRFSPVYAISGMTGRPDPTLMLSIDVEIVDAPALTGTEKQISYAEAIRDAAIRDACTSAIKRAPLSGDGVKNLNEQIGPIAAKLATITTAKSWIEAANGSKSLLTVRALLAK